MPRDGFKSITMREHVYDYLFEMYKSKKSKLNLKGINSFAAFIVSSIESRIKSDTVFAKHAPKIEKVSADANRIILKDNIRDRIVEVTRNKSDLYCKFCDRDSCMHVGFCYSLVEYYRW